MHRKRVTSELHDSYFRLMTIKHPISKIQWAIVWALNYYLTQLSSGCQLPVEFQTARDQMWYGRPLPTEGALGKPPMEWTPTSGEQQRHNVTVISSGGQNMKFTLGHQLPLTCKPWTTLSNPCNKVRGKYISASSFLRPLLLCLLSLRRYVSSIYMYISAWISRWLYNNHIWMSI